MYCMFVLNNYTEVYIHTYIHSYTEMYRYWNNKTVMTSL